MRRLFFLALFAAAAWFGWNNWRGLIKAPGDEIVVVNHSGYTIERVRIGIGDNLAVFESVPNGNEQRRPWRGQAGGLFQVAWKPGDRVGESVWRGGAFEPSATPRVHRFEVATGGKVVSRSE